MNHYPFDHGDLSLLGLLIGQKTIKALCNRRVRFDVDAHKKHINCPICRIQLERYVTDNAYLIKIAPATSSPELIRALNDDINRVQKVLAQ